MTLTINTLTMLRKVCASNVFQNSLRCISTSEPLTQKESWLDKLLVRRIEPTKESHSRMLSDKEIIFELQTHNLKPGTGRDYLSNYEQYVKVVGERKLKTELQGSWSVAVGDQDQCLHLWKYDGGYATLDDCHKVLTNDKEVTDLIQDRNKYLRQRSNQFLLSFSFWPLPLPREGNNLYEIRSYFLKPGTMIEWGNNWARAIHFRVANNEAYGGFFSQVGRLYNVHHVWCYDSLHGRKEGRERAWLIPGWSEVVAYTVPLIKEMHTRIMVSNSFSPTK